jgi:hypothetical protein
VRRSSGHRELDNGGEHRAPRLASFDPFPPTMRERYRCCVSPASGSSSAASATAPSGGPP